MGLRFRRSMRLFPGVRVNFSRSGISTSVGVRGASMTLGPGGTHVNVGLPGTGVSYRTRVPPSPLRGRPTPVFPEGTQPCPRASPVVPEVSPRDSGETLIRSADVRVLTSPGLGDLKELINEAELKRRELQNRMAIARQRLAKAAHQLKFAQAFVIRLFTEKRIPGLVERANAASDALSRVEGELDGCFVEVDFGFDEAAERSYANLIAVFDALKAAERIWDITATSRVNRVAERTIASTAVRRAPVSFGFVEPTLVRTRHRVMRLGDLGGRDLQVLPGFVMMRDLSGDFALIEFKEFECEATASPFIEEERVPQDAEQIGTTWKRANKDGSRDRRFNDNYPIPIVRYGELAISSPTGLREVYQISSYDKTAAFARAVDDHKRALARLTTSEHVRAESPSEDAGDDAEQGQPVFRVFKANPRTHLFLDYIVLATLVVGLGMGAFWTITNRSRPTTATPTAQSGSTPLQAAPVIASSQPPKSHLIRRSHRHGRHHAGRTTR